MKTKNSNSDNNFANEIDEIIKNTAIDAANIEKIGALLLSFGYTTFIQASNIEILDALDTNTSGITSFDIIVFGQRFTVLGYLLLYISATKRLNEKTLANLHKGEENNLFVFETIKNSYLGSIFLNYFRLVEFAKLLE